MFSDICHWLLQPRECSCFSVFWFSAVPTQCGGKNTSVTQSVFNVCVCVCVCGGGGYKTQELKSHQSRSNIIIRDLKNVRHKCLLLLLLHGTNNVKDTWCFSYSYVLCCHASSLQYCFYISLYTERQNVRQQSGGRVIHCTRCQTNVYSWFYRYRADTKGRLLSWL